MKVCTKCKIPRELISYRKDKSRKDGLHPHCNICNNQVQRAWYDKNKKVAKQQARKSYHNNKSKISERRKTDRKAHPEKYTDASKLRYDPAKNKLNSWKYAGMKNMSHERYDEMLKNQKHACAICKKSQTCFKRKLCVDHNHSTGEVRGLLCDACNRGIGYLKDSTILLEQAIKYLSCQK